MTNNVEYPLIHYPEGYDERAEAETSAKGWLSDIVVQMEDGSKYPVAFIDPVRLQQDMEEYVRLGTPYFSEPGLIVLAEITRESIRRAVKELRQTGFFGHLRPLPVGLAATVPTSNGA